MEDCRIIEGAGVRLEALSANHLSELRKIGNDPALWEFTFQPNPFTSASEACAWLHDAVTPCDTRAYAIVEKQWGRITGSTRFAEISTEHRKLEIGWTFLGKPFWRTYVNTESKFLLMRYAFEQWNAVRVQFKAEAINT
jgi:RimJ/RimL family protein N-acetyltransferase